MLLLVICLACASGEQLDGPTSQPDAGADLAGGSDISTDALNDARGAPDTAPADTARDVPDTADDTDTADASDTTDTPELPDAESDPSDDASDADPTPQYPTLTDLWEGRASFQVDAEHGALGPEGFHFLSTWWEGEQLYAYYIRNIVVDGIGRSATGLALSPDGITFEDQGIALSHGGSWDRDWWATHPALGHATGAADADGWAANTADHAEGHMVYGPYVEDLAAGPQTASFQLLIDVVDAPDDVVATIDVFDATDERTLSTRDLRRAEFASNLEYQIFNLDWVQTAGHRMELRVYFHRRAYVRVRTVAVAQGHAPFPDDRLASFPGVWRDDSTWYLTYEAAGTDRRWPGDVALATSPDGRTFTRHNPTPLLGHLDGGWEDVNIGTPSLFKHEGTWYLFYHGFDGTDVQIGVATGPTFDRLTRHPSNPILRTSRAGWDSGTVGARSIIRDGNAWYMAYEGSTDAPFDRANWSTGLARSTDLINWQKYSDNPVLPVTNASFGYDGPEFVRTPDGRTHIYYRDPGPGNRTWRATLSWH